MNSSFRAAIRIKGLRDETLLQEARSAQRLNCLPLNTRIAETSVATSYSRANTSFANCVATACALLIGTPIKLTEK